MSRAFVKEDDFVEDLPDRTISEHPNIVTSKGLMMLDDALVAARRNFAEAQAAGSREALADAVRNLRYWSARRASAQLAPPPSDPATVKFGSIVTIVREDGRKQTFRIVGEDEADPVDGTLSVASPLAASLMGKSEGDNVRAGRDDAEIVAIKV